MSLRAIYGARAPIALLTLATFLSSMLPAGRALAEEGGGGEPEPAAAPDAHDYQEMIDGAAAHAGEALKDGFTSGLQSDAATAGGEAPGLSEDSALPQGGDKSGVTSQALSMPSGAGTVTGMDESFSMQLSTGVATYSVPFKLPSVRGRVEASLGLTYSSSGGFGVAGVGWSLGVPFIARQTDRGIPKYDDRGAWHPEQDRFVFNGGQELVPICVVTGTDQCLAEDGSSQLLPGERIPGWFSGWQYFRPRVEGSFLRFFWSPDGRTWRVQSKTGVTLELGIPLGGPGSDPGIGSAEALERNPLRPSEIHRWMLSRQYDTYGDANPELSGAAPAPANVVEYRYVEDGGHLYLSDIFDTPPPGGAATLASYAHHTRLSYEPRTDPTTSYRSGWLIEQNLRLSQVDVLSKPFQNAGDHEPVRSYLLEYEPGRHASLLRSVQVLGRDGTALPPMRFRYSHVGDDPHATFHGYEVFDERIRQVAQSPRHSIDEQLTDLFDVNSDGLPDVVVTAPALFGGQHGVWFNGGASLDALVFQPGTIGVLPPAATPADANVLKLSNGNVAPLDLDADGRIDLVHMPRVKRYSIFSPQQVASAAALPGADLLDLSGFTGPGWYWVGRAVETASGQDPKIDFTNRADTIRVMDVDNDGLVDVVVSTGTQMQTFFSLGRYAAGDGQFGQAFWQSAAEAAIDNEPVRTCVPWSGSAIRFSDPEIRIADMNGDGLPDIVRVRPGDVRYWPGRGNGFWGTGPRDDCPAGTFAQDRHVAMTESPQYGVVQGDSLLVDDVNGDGLADIVEVRFHDVDIYLNVDGRSWTRRHVIRRTPPNPESNERVRLVDINGSGTRDILWGDGRDYKYIDLQGGGRPWLLTEVANGLGKTTSIAYGTSTGEMLAAEAAGQPWTSKMPMVAHVVKSVTESDHLVIAGRPPGTYRTEYTYRDPVYDGRQREFRGFRHAAARRVGDSNSPTDVTETTFLLGECVDETLDPAFDQCAIQNRWIDNPREALKGLPVITEKRDERGTTLSSAHTTYRLRPLYTGLDGRQVRHAFAAGEDTYLYDTAPFTPGGALIGITAAEVETGAPCRPGAPDDPCAIELPFQIRSPKAARIRSVSELDLFGNRTEQIAFGCVEGCPDGPDEVIVSFTDPGRPDGDPTGWLWRTVSSRVEGSEHPDEPRNWTRTHHNPQGDVVRVEAFLDGTLPLRRRDEALATVDPPRSSTTPGWIDVVSLREYDAFGNMTGELAPNQRCRTVGYDPLFAHLPTRETIFTEGCTGPPSTHPEGTGNPLTTAASYDRGFELVELFVDIQKQTTFATYDGLGRLATLTRPDRAPGSLCAEPSVRVQYLLPTLQESDAGSPTPAVASLQELYTRPYSVIHTETQDGAGCATPDYLVSQSFVDGLGRDIVTFHEADPSPLGNDRARWIASALLEHDDKSAVRRKYLDFFWDGDDPAQGYSLAAVPEAPYGRQRYDAFGRQIQTFDLDGTVTLQSRYHELSTDLFDAADLQPGPHQGSHATEHHDGHGRTILTIERFRDEGSPGGRKTRIDYLPTGEPERITRTRGTGSGSGTESVVRWMRYDSLGRMVLGVDPNTTPNFTADLHAPADSVDAWRYAYNDAGDLVGTSDARGCGVSYFHDGAGRLLMEDYFPCEEHHAPYSAPKLVPGSPEGIEVFYEYDRIPDVIGTEQAPVRYTLQSDLARGHLIRVRDRGSDVLYSYDARGRQTQIAKRIAKPGPSTDILHDRYGMQWFEREIAYDAADRPARESTGLVPDDGSTPPGHVIHELLGEGGVSEIAYTYSRRGTLNRVDSSYGTLVAAIQRTADALTTRIEYGDAASTTTTSSYDDRRRLSTVQTARSRLPDWPDIGVTPPTTFQMLLQDEQYLYDVVNNPVEIRDWRIPEEWPHGTKPVTKKIQYDDLYRATRIDYEYTDGDDTWTSPHAAENAAARRGGGNQDELDPRLAQPTPHVAFDRRVLWQTFQYDWLGNTQRTNDDARGFYDRSLGDIENGTSENGPYQLRSAAHPTGARSGTLRTRHDAAGNITRLLVDRDGPCLPDRASCQQWFEYHWDEVGRLVRARRWDGEAEPRNPREDPPRIPTGPTDADLQYLYDADDQRVVKSAFGSGSTTRHTAYIFPTLELRRARFIPGDEHYEATPMTLVPYLVAGGVRLARLVYKTPEPFPGAGNLHVFFELGDHLGSTSAVLDKKTGELVERATYQGYGAAESDYRPERWGSFREDYRFTGKEEDVEVGLVYFGKRFYAPLLGRWVSPDPLAVHVPGEADLNLYAYVRGMALKAIDPLGLQDAPFERYGDTEQGFQDFSAGRLPQAEQGADYVFHADTIVVKAPGGPPVQHQGVYLATPEGNPATRGRILETQLLNDTTATGLEIAGTALDLATGNLTPLPFAELSIARRVDQVSDAMMAGRRLTIGGRADSGLDYAANVIEGGTGRAFAGHGEYRLLSGDVTLPKGTTLTTWTSHGRGIPDEMGRLIELGEYQQIGARFAGRAEGAASWLPGATIPNYTLKPPTGLTVMSESITVPQATPLSELLRPNLGHMNWAACLKCR